MTSNRWAGDRLGAACLRVAEGRGTAADVNTVLGAVRAQAGEARAGVDPEDMSLSFDGAAALVDLLWSLRGVRRATQGQLQCRGTLEDANREGLLDPTGRGEVF